MPETGFARPLEVFVRFLKLGLSSFGGPVAHFGYFRREFVERSGWLGDAEYGEIVAAVLGAARTDQQPGGHLAGNDAGRPLGGLLAWLAFTTPSALVALPCSAWRCGPAAGAAIADRCRSAARALGSGGGGRGVGRGEHGAQPHQDAADTR